MNAPPLICATALAAAYYYARGRRVAYTIAATMLILSHLTSCVFIAIFVAHHAWDGRRKGLGAAQILRSGWYLGLPSFAFAAWLLHHGTDFHWISAANPFIQAPHFFSRLGYDAFNHFVFDPTDSNVNRFNWILLGFIIFFGFRSDTDLGRGWAARLWLLAAVFYTVLFALADDLPRYFLPILPFFYVAASIAICGSLEPRIGRIGGLGVIAFVCALFTTNYHGTRQAPPWKLESNMEYADYIDVQREASRYAEENFKSEEIVTCWPMSSALQEPHLGYVTQPLRVSRDWAHPSQGSIVYFSGQAPCYQDPQSQLIRAQLRPLAVFEKNGKQAAFYRFVFP